MAVELKQFVKRLTATMLMSADEVRAFLDGLPPDEQPRTGKELAEQLARNQWLTPFQAQAVYDGKGEGLVLGNYVILDRIGQGGMGTVYKAQHREMKRVVAIKVLAPHLTKTPEGLKRFQREARAAAALNHPHIVTAYDAAESKGARYLVMEYVDGADLASVVKSTGPLPVSRAVQYVLHVARALEYAHSKGIIHRDIKPSNLLVDRQDNVKILDLGLARIQDPEGSTTTDFSVIELTRTGMVLGTVDYMPPEQALGAKDIDHRADIYSLGISLYYLLTGRVPYEGSTLLARFLAHREQEIPSLKEWAPDVPDSLDRVFRKMVAKEAKDRYATMSEVVADLEACLAESPESSVTPASQEPDSAWPDVLRAVVGPAAPPEASRAASAAVVEAPPVAGGKQAAAVTTVVAPAETRQTIRRKAVGLLAASLARPFASVRAPLLMGVSGGVLLVLIVLLLIMLSNEQRPGEIAFRARPPSGVPIPPPRLAGRVDRRATGEPAPTLGTPKTSAPRAQPQSAVVEDPKPGEEPERAEPKPLQAFEQHRAKDHTESSTSEPKREKLLIPRPPPSVPPAAPRGRAPTEPAPSPVVKPDATGPAPNAIPPPANVKPFVLRNLSAMPQTNPRELLAYLMEFAVDVKLGGDPKGSIPEMELGLRLLEQLIRRKLQASDNILDLDVVEHSDRAILEAVMTPGFEPPGHVINLKAELKCFKPDGAIVVVWSANSQGKNVFRVVPVESASQRSKIWEREVLNFFEPLGSDHREARRTLGLGKRQTVRGASPVSLPPRMTNSTGMTFVLIPPGEFLMGSREFLTGYGEGGVRYTTDYGTQISAGMENEKPQHTVRLTREFYLGVKEVTQEQYQRVMGHNPSSFKGDLQRPVESVSWEDAFQFCRKLSEKEKGPMYRLPTEAQWEYACRAGSMKAFSFGEDASALKEYAWYMRNAERTTHPVAQKKPNAWGLYDMHGNVWEWCWDWYQRRYYHSYQERYYDSWPREDPVGPSTGVERVFRGGSLFSPDDLCRCGYRGYVSPKNRYHDVGFRVVCNPSGGSSETTANPEPAVTPPKPALPREVAKPSIPQEPAISGGLRSVN